MRLGSGLRLVLAALCAAAIVGALFSPVTSAAKANVAVDGQSVSRETWMHDLAAHLWSRKLTDIVIPGSHDSATFGLDGPDWDYAGTQNHDETITAALNQGIRQFDIRVKYKDWGGTTGAGYWGYHGASISMRLRFDQLLDQVRDWTMAPGHEQEIILVSLIIDTDNGRDPFPTTTCRNFADALGSALLTPNELMDRFGTADVGQVTLGQLWSMPGHPRVVMNNAQCMGPSAGQWSVDPFGGGYYANQCYAPSYLGVLPEPGITAMVLAAARSRASTGPVGGDFFPGTAISVGSPKVGGLYLVNIQATTTFDCATPLRWFDLDADRAVLNALYEQWQTDPATRAHLNIISGDFVEETDLVTDVIAMDASWPIRGDTVTRLGPERVVAMTDGAFPRGSFAAFVNYQGTPAPLQQVLYHVSPDIGRAGPNMEGAASFSRQAVDGEVSLVKPPLFAGPQPGTWTLTASVDGGATSATWELVVEGAPRLRPPQSKLTYTVEPVAGNPATLQVGSTLSDGFAVRVISTIDRKSGPAPGQRVEFDAWSARGGFPGPGIGRDGRPLIDKRVDAFTNAAGIARSPAFTAGTLAGSGSILVTGPGGGRSSLSLPVTVTAGPAHEFVPLNGNLQATPINTRYAVPLTGHYLDRYGNVVTELPRPLQALSVDPPSATWPDGAIRIQVTPAADGTIVAPDLRAGQINLHGAPAQTVHVFAGPLSGWTLSITPGRPAAITIDGGEHQRPTVSGQPFDRRLAVRLTDAGGNPIPEAPVTFRVLSGSASFPPVNSLVAGLTADQALADDVTPRTGRHEAVVPTDADGIATAPVLTAGEKPGGIIVSASARGVNGPNSARFSLSAR